MAEVLCARCGTAVPFTGAFAFVICPRCSQLIYVAHAARAPPRPVPLGYAPLPVAASLQPPFETLQEPVHFVRRIARTAAIAGTGLMFFLLAAELAALLLGAPTAWSYARSTSDPIVYIFVAFPFPIILGSLGGLAAVAWHGLLVGAIVASVAFLLREHAREAWGKFMATMEGYGAPSLSEPNALFAMARMFSLSVFVAVAINVVAEALGSSPRIPPGLESEPVGSMLITLAHASVWEELVTRVLLLGLPLAAIHFAGRGRLEYRPHRYLLGGKIALEGPVVALLVFQALVFSLAHVPGWDLWKFPSAFVAGLAFGFLFLRYGLYASILVHFISDYLSPVLSLTSATAFPLLVLLAFYALLAVGAVHAVRYVFVLREVMSEGKVPEYLGGPAPRPPRPVAAVVANVAAPVAAPAEAGAPPGPPPAPPDAAP